MSRVREDLESFHQFAVNRLAERAPVISLTELFAEWYDLRERESVNEAIREGLADVAAGRVVPAREAVQEIRKEFGFR